MRWRCHRCRTAVPLAVEYLSIDPTIRGWMSYDTHLPKIVKVTIRSAGAGEVVENPQ